MILFQMLNPMNEQNQGLDKADQALKEMLVIAKSYGLSYVVVLTDEYSASCQFDIPENCTDRKLLAENLCKATGLMYQSLRNEYQRQGPKGFTSKMLAKKKGH